MKVLESKMKVLESGVVSLESKMNELNGCSSLRDLSGSRW